MFETTTRMCLTFVHRVGRGVRRIALAVCLLPAVPLRHECPAAWRAALGSPRAFFQDLAEHVGDMTADCRQRGGWLRWTAGPSLILAGMLLDRRGWRAALPPRMRGVLARFGWTPFPPPGLVRLLDGLAQPAGTGQFQAVQPGPPSWPLAGAVRVLHGAGRNFAGTRTAVVAHWDSRGRVDPYVTYMCRQLKGAGFQVVLASGRLAPDMAPPDGWADAVVLRQGPGYDFASWKAALCAIASLRDCAELVWCNDSVFGGIGSYAAMHAAMARVACDFWGVTESRETMPHLQSYYLVFRPSALHSQALADFLDQVPLVDDRDAAVACEVRLSRRLALHGLRPAAFAPLPPGARDDVNPSCEFWRELLEAGVPMLKRELLLRNGRGVSLAGWTRQLAARGYPLELIVAYCNRQGIDPTPALHADIPAAVWPPHVQAFYRSLPPAAPEARTDAADAAALSLGAFVHVYYLETAAQLFACAANLPSRTRLFVSTDSEAKKDSLWSLLGRAGLADRAVVRVFPNQGWDIAPFLVGFGAELAGCDLLLRLHSKRSLHLPGDLGESWREMLCASLAGSRERVDRILGLFVRDPQLGMVAPPLLPAYAGSLLPGSNLTAMQTLLARHGVGVTAQTPIDYPMGSMFWCRSRALEPWLGLGLAFADFAPTREANRDGDLAHALERLFFYGCALEGLGFGRLAASGPMDGPDLD